jgi:hypothetical protein
MASSFRGATTRGGSELRAAGAGVRSAAIDQCEDELLGPTESEENGITS